jgi:hypothetical protein
MQGNALQVSWSEWDAIYFRELGEAAQIFDIDPNGYLIGLIDHPSMLEDLLECESLIGRHKYLLDQILQLRAHMLHFRD